jgi:hypothetical protein
MLLKNSLVELLLKNCPLTHSRPSYITLNRTSVTTATSQVRAVLRHSRKREGRAILPYSCSRVTSPRHVAYEPYSNTVAWRHCVCEEILFTGRLPSDALLRNPCCATQQWVNMSQYTLWNPYLFKSFYRITVIIDDGFRVRNQCQLISTKWIICPVSGQMLELCHKNSTNVITQSEHVK